MQLMEINKEKQKLKQLKVALDILKKAKKEKGLCFLNSACRPSVLVLNKCDVALQIEIPYIVVVSQLTNMVERTKRNIRNLGGTIKE